MLKKSLSCFFGLLLVASLVQFSEAKDKIVLRAVTPWSEQSVDHEAFFMFLEEVNKRFGDRVEVKYLGASDIIPTFSQFEMLGKGAFEIGHLPGNYAKNFFPAAEALHLSRIKPWEERTTGVYDILREGFEKTMNVHYLGKVGPGQGHRYYLFSNFEVKNLKDFQGKTFRIAPIGIPLLKALGAGSVTLPPGEVFTAMERGVVDGYGWTLMGIVEYGWTDVTKYVIDPGFYPVGNGIFFNSDTWKKLPADIRAGMEEMVKLMEFTMYGYYTHIVKERKKLILEKGMKFMKLPPAEADKYIKLAFQEGWKEVIKKDPELGPKLKELTSPK